MHGEGVAIGLAQAFRFSARLGLCNGQDATRVGAAPRAGRPADAHLGHPGFHADAEAILDAMLQDKKVERGALTFVLVRGIGGAFVAKSVEAKEVLAASSKAKSDAFASGSGL